ncbi:MAG: immunoglobulin-like domain-containing protein [Candidatus Izemoplasmatales bacterium]
MKSLFTKKVIIVFSVILAIAVGAVILGLAVGNTYIPTVENGKEIVYEKVDENGDVVYTITKQELYEEMKRNNGINQLLSLIDEKLLETYLDDISQEEIDEKIELLKYQTNDQDVIDEYDQDTLDDLEENFQRSMILSGYHNNQEDEYAKLLIAREKFVMDTMVENDDITQNDVAKYYLNSYFEDIKAIRLRFLSRSDAFNVLREFNLGSVDDQLGLYLGYTYEDEDLLDPNDEIVEALITIDTYYYDDEDNIVDVNEEVIYEFDEDIYTDEDDNTYTIDGSGNLIDDENNIVIDNSVIFETLDEAEAHKEANTSYFTIVENGDIIEVYDLDGVLTYKVDDDVIYDAGDNDVTDSVDLIFNKEFTDIIDVKDFTENNTSELTDEEVMTYYIKMYNYIYNEYRDEIPETSTLEDLLTSDSDYLDYSFEDVTENNASLATYMFSDISQINDKTYSAEPKAIDEYAYMVFKLSEGQKVDLKAEVMEVIKSAIIVPETATSSFELITEGPYDSTISWKSSKPEVITKEGTVFAPTEDTLVSLSYTINVLGVQETGTKIVKVPVTGETSAVEVFDEEYDSLKTIINDDDVYNEIEQIILEDKVYGENARTNINQYLMEARKDANFDINDFFLSLDYQSNHDGDFEYEGRGHKTILASIDLEDGPFNVSAEDFYQRGLMRNPSLMIFYAAQYEEAIHSDHFATLFGEERNIDKNDSEYMGFLKDYITNIKNEYNQLLSNPTYLDIYKQYYGWNFDSFQTYLYSRYRVENEKMLVENLVLSELRMSFIKEALDGENIVDKIYSVAEENYENFFSLKAQQILIYFDFNEDGDLDDYNEYYDGLSEEDQTQFDTWVSQLETLIQDSDESFRDIVTEYKDAARDDEDWGIFKQNGFILKHESLNPTDDDDNVHSMTYSGEYGVKDQYIDEFTDALIDLYNEYQNPVNADAEELVSDLVPTEFGLHLIEASKGSDFDGVSLEIQADDYNNISDSLLNDDAKPSLSQIDAYYTYKIYEEYNDLENVSMVEKYGVTLPVIPTEVLEDLDIYAGETLELLFGNETINYAFMLKVIDGNIHSGLSQSEFETNVQSLLEIYYDASIGAIETEE